MTFILKLHTTKTDPKTPTFTFDVTNLHCNISYELEKQVISFWREKYSERLNLIFNMRFNRF